MSEHQSTDDSRDRILNRLRGRLVSIAALSLAVILFMLLSGCDSSPQATQTTTETSETANAANSAPVPVQPVGEQTIAPEEGETQLADNDHVDIALTIRFTDSNEDIWPPQPENITDVTTMAFSNDAAKSKINQAINTNPEAGSTLSTRREILTRRIVRDKNGKASHTNSEIFDYEKNQVVTLEFDASTTKIVSKSIADAQDYQPPESPAEVARAIELASLSLSKQGFTEHTSLTGTGLLAYPGTAESAASGANFFKHRKIYVTFGTGNGELPLYRALVNLSTNTVESSGSMQ